MKKILFISISLFSFNLFSQENNYKTTEAAREFINRKFELVKSIFRIDKNFNVSITNELSNASVDIKKVFITTEIKGDFAFNLNIDCINGDCWKEKTKKGVITFSKGFGELMTNKESEDSKQIIEAFQFIQTKIMGYAPTKHN